MYEGAQRPKSEIAELHYPEPISYLFPQVVENSEMTTLTSVPIGSIERIDGKVVSGSGIYELAPGTHDLLIHYYNIYFTGRRPNGDEFGKVVVNLDKPPRGPTPPPYSYYKQERTANVRFEAEAGHVYSAAHWLIRVFDPLEKFDTHDEANGYYDISYRTFDSAGRERTQSLYRNPAVAPVVPLRIFDATKMKFVDENAEVLAREQSITLTAEFVGKPPSEGVSQTDPMDPQSGEWRHSVGQFEQHRLEQMGFRSGINLLQVEPPEPMPIKLTLSGVPDALSWRLADPSVADVSESGRTAILKFSRGGRTVLTVFSANKALFSILVEAYNFSGDKKLWRAAFVGMQPGIEVVLGLST